MNKTCVLGCTLDTDGNCEHIAAVHDLAVFTKNRSITPLLLQYAQNEKLFSQDINKAIIDEAAMQEHAVALYVPLQQNICTFGICVMDGDTQCYHATAANILAEYLQTGRLTNELFLRAYQKQWYSEAINEKIIRENNAIRNHMIRFRTAVWIGQQVYIQAKGSSWHPWTVSENSNKLKLVYCGGGRVLIVVGNGAAYMSMVGIEKVADSLGLDDMNITPKEAKQLVDWVIAQTPTNKNE